MLHIFCGNFWSDLMFDASFIEKYEGGIGGGGGGRGFLFHILQNYSSSTLTRKLKLNRCSSALVQLIIFLQSKAI